MSGNAQPIGVVTSGGARNRPSDGLFATLARWVHENERLALGVVGVVGFLLTWEIGARIGIIDEFFFSRPIAIVAAAIREVQLPRFWVDARATATELIAGYTLAIVAAVPIGLAAGWFRRFQYTLDPWLNFFNALPRVALIPIVLIVLGLGIASKVAIAFLAAFFSIVLPTLHGVRTVDSRFIDVALSFRASRRQLFLSVVAPATVPFIITGLRLGLGRSLIAIFVVEHAVATDGLGVMIQRAADNLQADRMLFAVLLFTASGILGAEAIRRIEARFQRWRPVQEG